VITVKSIARREDWIAYVSHDEDDGSWQFHTNSPEPPSEADAAVVSLASIVEMDPTIPMLADLPLGWQAVRSDISAPWHRSKR
jgi:hypothetical protein